MENDKYSNEDNKDVNEEISYLKETIDKDNKEKEEKLGSLGDEKEKKCINKNPFFSKNFILAILVIVLLAFNIFYISNSYMNKNINKTKVAKIAQEETNEQTTIQAISKAKDAVVSVVSYSSKNGNDDLESILRGKQQKGELKVTSSGSGVIYKKEGNTAYVVTNLHVINGAEKVDIILSDGTSVKAEIVGSDLWTDLAVLKINSEKVTTVMDFSNSDEVAVGQSAYAIGSPLGVSFSNSVTKGIVSAKERQIPMDIDKNGTYDWYQTVIQTDAAINPGNSGGALINSSGELIGINELKISNASKGVSAEGIGFVIPANEVKIIVEQLEKSGKVIRPALGVQIMSVASLNSDFVQSKLKYDINNKGVVITSIEPNSASSEAGLKEYDIITKINDKKINNVAELRKYLFEKTKIGETINITYFRDGKENTVSLTLKTLGQ